MKEHVDDDRKTYVDVTNLHLDHFSVLLDPLFKQYNVINYCFIGPTLIDDLSFLFANLHGYVTGYIIQSCSDSHAQVTFLTKLSSYSLHKRINKLLSDSKGGIFYV